jgi:methionyl-tRNA formyltransferase
VVAYGRLIPKEILDQIRMVNVHFSLLPRWRGAAPVERAILAGDVDTGVDIMAVEETLDTGVIFAEVKVSIGSKDAATLTGELANKGAALLVETLANDPGLTSFREQVGEPTYAEKLSNTDFLVLPTSTAREAHRQVQVGRAFTFVGAKRLRILEATVASHVVPEGVLAFASGQVLLGFREGSLALGRVQPEGAKAMDAHAWWGGARLVSGEATWGHADTSGA